MKFRCALFLSVAILSAHTAPALTVINRADSGAGSLRQVIIDAPSGETITFETLCRIDTLVEVEYYRNGGILHTVLRDFLDS